MNYDPTYKRDMWIIATLVGILMTLFVTAAVAAPVSTWSGAGPNACHGQCPQDWAESKLTPSELKELNSLRSSQPNPQPIEIRNGDVFRLATYFKDGKPVAYRTTTVAVLEESTGAMGWHMDGWSWVKLDACSNWTLVEHVGIYPNTTPVPERTTSTKIPPPTTVSFVPYPTSPFTWTTTTPELWTPVETPDPHIPAVPLSPSLAFLFLAIGSLLFLKRRMIYARST